MVASVQNKSKHFLPTSRTNVRIAEFDIIPRILFKILSSSKSKNFQSIGFDFYTCVNIYDYHHSTVLCSLDMQFNKHAVVLLHGRERLRMPFTHFFQRKNAFPSIF